MQDFDGTIQGTVDDQGNATFTGQFQMRRPHPPAPVPPPTPPPTNPALVDFTAGGASTTAAFAAHVVPGRDFNAIPSAMRLQSTRNHWDNGIDVAQGRLLFPINWIAPTYNHGEFKTSLPVNPPNAHCQVRLASVGLEQKAWTKPEIEYTWEAEIDMPPTSDWQNLGWVLPMQGHPGSYGPDWVDMHHRPPCISVLMKRDHWEFLVRGSNEVKPTKMTQSSHFGRVGEVPFSPGLQRLKIDFRCDPMSSYSFVKFWLNGAGIVEFNQPVGMNYSALGHGKPALNLAMGYYGSHPTNLPNPQQAGVVSINSTRLTENVFTPPLPPTPVPPPPPTTAPQLSVENDSFNSPMLQALPGQKRGWFYPSLVYSHSDFHVFSPVDDHDGRHLYTTTLSNPTIRRKLKDDVEQVAVWKEGGTFRMSGIGKDSRGFHFFNGIALNRADWAFQGQSSPSTGSYPMGDVHTQVKGHGLWIKGHDWVKQPSGTNVIDFKRRWFHAGQELKGLIPPPPIDGLRYEVYMLSIIAPADHNWASKTKYVALVGMFKITDPQPTPNQHGPINLVWATSDDGVNWNLPWGDTPAVDRGQVGMVGPSFNMLPWGSKLLVHCGVHHCLHNEFGSNPTVTVGMGLASIGKSDFETFFG